MTTTPRSLERCAIYTRQSVGGRGGGTVTTSCAIQYEQCVELVRRRGWEPVFERFDDWGQSGASLDRPAFKRLVRRIEEGGIDRVVAYRLDRISRTMSDWVEFDNMLRARGIGFTVGDGAIDRRGSTLASFQMNMLATFAQFEREMIADRIRDGRAMRSARGERTAGKLPFGYRSDRRTKQLVIEPAEAEVVRWMFGEADRGALPAHIAFGASARTTRAWTARSVSRALNSLVYAGMLPDGRPGAHPGIVTREQQARVLDLIRARRTREPASRAGAPLVDPFLLRGVLVCASCSGRMTTETSTRPRRPRAEPHRYYRCRRSGCDGGQVSAPYVEGRFIALLLGDHRSHLSTRAREVIDALGQIWHYLIPSNQRLAVRLKFECIVLRKNRTLAVSLRATSESNAPSAASSSAAAPVELSNRLLED